MPYRPLLFFYFFAAGDFFSFTFDNFTLTDLVHVCNRQYTKYICIFSQKRILPIVFFFFIFGGTT